MESGHGTGFIIFWVIEKLDCIGENPMDFDGSEIMFV